MKITSCILYSNYWNLCYNIAVIQIESNILNFGGTFMKSKLKLLSLFIAVLLLLQCLFINYQPVVYAKAANIPDILITEIMPYSQGTNDAYEYIELYNSSGNAINLKDYKLALPDIDISPSKTIAPKNTIVICTTNTSLADFNKYYGTSLTDDKFLNLSQTGEVFNNNSSASIILIKDDGTVIARAYYEKYDFNIKKSITYKYPQSGFDMYKVGSNQTPTPGIVASSQVPYEGVKVTGVSLNKETVSLELNKTCQLYATIVPESATNKTVAWSSRNTGIAAVSNDGLVTAKSLGNTVITAKTLDGGYTASCLVSVNTVPVTGITLNKTSLNLEIGKPVMLIPAITPDNATNKTVIWSSNNSSIASVDKFGIVTGKLAGTAKITATTVDGSYKAACDITINGTGTNIPVTGIKLNKSNASIEIGKALMLEAKVIPDNAADKKVIWYSYKPEVASVEDGLVMAKSEGVTLIKATTEDGGYTATCIVTVTKTSNSYVAVTGVKLNKALVILKQNQTEKLNAAVKPDNATNKNVTWSSSNKDIASIDSSGNVKANNVGIAVITVTTNDGNYTDRCYILVEKCENASVTGIRLNKTVLYLSVRKSEKLVAIIIPGNARDKYVTWTTSNKKIAVVTGDGKVTGIKSGFAIITAATRDGKKSAKCIVFVNYKRGKGHNK